MSKAIAVIIGLIEQIIGSNDHLRVTFVRKNGRLVPLPDGLMMMVPTKILPLIRTPLLITEHVPKLRNLDQKLTALWVGTL